MAAICAVLTVVLGARYAGESTPSAFDAAVFRAIEDLLGGQDALLRVMVAPTQPYVLLPVIALVAVACALGRRWPELAVTLLGPGIAVAANTWLLKPLFDRHKDGLAYPSGHTVSLVSVLVVLFLLARPGVASALVAAAGCLLVLSAGTGMVGLGYHYATDVFGGVLFAVAAVLAVRLATGRRPWPARSTGSPPAGTSSDIRRAASPR